MVVVIQKASGLTRGAEVMDAALLKRARAEGKAVRFLETAEEQFAILERTMDAEMLTALTKELDSLTGQFRSMTAAYRAGDIVALEALAQDDARTGMSSEQMSRLLGTRNERWVPFLETLAADGGGFVAVRALHLPGKDGLVAMLRARGHRVARIVATAPAQSSLSP